MKKCLVLIFCIFICKTAWCESMSTSSFLEALDFADTDRIKKYIEKTVNVTDPYLKGNYTFTKEEAVEYLLILIESAKILKKDEKKISFICGKTSIIDLIFENKNGKLILIEIMIDQY